jgi:hypothetical protein
MKKIARKRGKSKRSRAQAAKLGWQRRKARRRAQLRLEQRRARELLHPELAGIESVFDKRVQEEVKRQLPELRSKIRQEIVDETLKGTEFVESDETKIIARLILAEVQNEFKQELYNLSFEYERPVSEIFTLWIYSGGNKDVY